ncbi:hypothetical protein B9X49_17860 [Acinetobacter baumannii]|uniref:hypothetical protein n=1 Tax=Acinetobacter baumannii TaxID=470 RepID=UPI0002BB3137|nr:hypothetical protein [Acinetobacter baumannii]QJS52908.1 hypothetical protein phiAb1151011551_00027 [Acinetobacter phage Ab11510-phi]ANC38195.1 hypothetical protein Aba3207_16845 [Acinetobacter baumannii]ATD20548.1 hypothetical protein BS098_11885 [Acinetobacter baumannii]AVE45973.1 hypothetical protein AM435_09780 [Acinetobacter baumannii]AVE47496.1 hypothetical protein AM435_18400 [Acinetobacter baumannii]
MASRKLEDKIKRVCYFVGGGVIGYLLISFIILSSFPWNHYLLDKKQAYDVLKDAFTIGAAFLAPIAAFVLFNDWREQHVAVKNEKLSEEILRIVTTDFLSFYNLNPRLKADVEKFNEQQMQFHRDVANLFLKVDEIDAVDDQAISFKENIKKLDGDFLGLYLSLFKQIEIVIEYDAIAEFLDTESLSRKEELKTDLDKYAKENEIHYTRIMEVFRKLKPLQVSS